MKDKRTRERQYQAVLGIIYVAGIVVTYFTAPWNGQASILGTVVVSILLPGLVLAGIGMLLLLPLAIIGKMAELLTELEKEFFG